MIGDLWYLASLLINIFDMAPALLIQHSYKAEFGVEYYS